LQFSELYLVCNRAYDSLVSKMTGLRADRIQTQVGCWNISLYWCVQKGSASYSTSYLVGTRSSYATGRVVECLQSLFLSTVTPWYRIFCFNVIWSFITVFTRTHHCTLFWTYCIQPTLLYAVSLRSVSCRDS
jgi:hypothetical protein